MSSKNIDHGVIETEELPDTNGDPEGSKARATSKIGTPLRVQEEFDWIYTGKRLLACVAAMGNHPVAVTLARQYEAESAEVFATLRKATEDQDAASLFDAALAVYLTERGNDSNWFMKAKPEVISELVKTVDLAVKQSLEKVKLGTAPKDIMERISEKVAAYTDALVHDSGLNWFQMKNNAGALVDAGYHETAAGIRRTIAGSDWYTRAVDRGDDKQIDGSISMQESGREQKLNGLVQIVAIKQIFDGLVTDEFSYPLRLSAENGVRSCLSIEAWSNAKKFQHPGALEASKATAKAGNTMLTAEAVSGF